MNELQQLVRRFVSGDLNYNQFRREFGPIFSRSDAERAIARICELVESECSAFEHGIIDEQGLKIVFNLQIAWPNVPPRNVPNPVQQIQLNGAGHLLLQPDAARNDVPRVRMIAA
jgi:hypothetical protein